MNTPHPSESAADPIYCPSCAARVNEASQPIPRPGDRLRCPVCGTEFKYEPPQTPEAAVAGTDHPSTLSPTHRLSTEEILLERLKSEPPQKRPVRWSSVALIFAILGAVAFGVFSITSKPDKFAPGEEPDSTVVLQKRLFFQHIIDSLHTELAAHPTSADIHLSLADALYDDAKWDESVKEFQIYLASKPSDADARVDYAYAIAQANGNLNDALTEIDTALIYKPDHLNALINAGIMTAQTVSDSNHTTALARARNYFVRARAVAEKTAPGIAARIDTLIQEIDNTGKRMAK